MNRRKLLATLTGVTFAGGFILAAVPFVSSMGPSDAAKSKAKVRVAISEIPENGALEVDYRWYKALVVKKPELAVFLMPYFDNAYRLPDPTWERSFVPCNNFIISEKGFSCEDPSLHESWNEQATWDLGGNSQGTWMPNLQQTNFKIKGKYLVLSPEYN